MKTKASNCFWNYAPLYCFALLLLSFSGARVTYAQPAVPALSGYVVDEADILSSDTESLVSTMLQQHEQETSNQVAVLTIKSLEGAVLESYSLDVARAWALGQADKNNGVLLLIAHADRKMRIEVGYGLEGDLPDILARRIIDNELRPYFRNGDFDGGVLQGARAIVGTIEGSYEPAEGQDIEDAPIFVRLIFGLMFIGMPLMVLTATAFQIGCIRWFLLFFFMPFFIGGGTVIWPPYGGFVIASVIFVVYIWFQWHIRNSPRWAEVQEALKKAKESGKAVDVVIGGTTISIGGRSSGSSGGGGWSSSSGGGFSGGGGSFGGGGASGGW